MPPRSITLQGERCPTGSGRVPQPVHREASPRTAGAAVLLSLAFLFGCGGSFAPPPLPGISVTVQPATATVTLGQSQPFTVTVTGTNNLSVTWSVNGVAGGNASLGTISSTGLYTAPAHPPNPPTVNVIAALQADPSKQANAQVTITSQVAVALAPSSARVPVKGEQIFVASVTGSPDRAVRWSVNGIAEGNAALGTIAAGGTYTAPALVPNPSMVAVEATSVADPSRRATAEVMIHIRISIAPFSVSLAPGGTQTFSASVEGSANPAVTWSVNGIAGGDPSVGTITSAGVYTAPANPAAGSVEVTATSQSDPSQSASATVTLVVGVSVTVAPLNPTVVFGGSQAFTATVVGSSDTRVEWSVNNQVGGAAATGTISLSGLYQAPAIPAMDSIEVEARSAADPTKVGRAMVRFFGLRKLGPRALSAGASGPITLAASGANLDASTVLEVNSAGRVTILSGGALRTTLAPSDLDQPGTLAVSARAALGLASNALSLVIAPRPASPATVTVSASSPTLAGQDIIVTDDSGEGLLAPVKLNLLLLSPLSGGNCAGLAARPLRLKRPAAGNATFGVCVAADGLSSEVSQLQFSLSGPLDVTLGNLRTATSGSAGVVVLDLLLTTSTVSGARSLILHNANHDISVAFGGIVIE